MANQPPDVVPAIFGATTNPQARTAMTFGSGLESGWSDTATNPSSATGPFQILLSAHPDISFTQAEDPNTATEYMLPAYKAALNQVPSSLWKTNPEVAAERTVILAEQPGGPFPSGDTPTGYGSEGLDVVNQRWTETGQILQGNWNPGSGITLTSASGLPNIPGWLQQFLLGPLAPFFGKSGFQAGGILKIINFLANPMDALERIGLVLFGAVLVIVGLYVLSQGTAAGRLANPIAKAPAEGAAARIRAQTSGNAARKDRQVKLQQRAMDIGERRVKVQESRQQRLSATAQLKAPAIGKHKRSET